MKKLGKYFTGIIGAAAAIILTASLAQAGEARLLTDEELDQITAAHINFDFEIPQKITAQLAIERAKYVCQTQSFNCFMKEINYQKMTSFLFYQWRNGAKTGMYYLRSKPPANAIKIATKKKELTKSKELTIVEDVQDVPIVEDVPICLACQ